MFNSSLSAATLAEVHKLTQGDAFKAGINTSLGLTAINLEADPRLLVPEFFPLVGGTEASGIAIIPRVTPPGNMAGLAPQWKQLTSFNAVNAKPYVQEGQRGTLLTYTEGNKTASYVTHGLENNITFEAESAAIGFTNADNLVTLGLLNEFMAQEERQVIGGNIGVALGQTGTPVTTLFATGGSLPTTGNVYLACVALTYDGWDLANTLGTVSQTISQPNAGPYGGSTAFNAGSGIISAVATQAMSGTAPSIVGTTNAITGATAYAWFAGSADNAHLYFQGITTINSINLTALTLSGQLFSALTGANDYSQTYLNAGGGQINPSTGIPLAYDGILSQTTEAGYNYVMPTGAAGVGGAGTGLTPTGTGQGIGIVEFETLLAYMWNTYKSTIGEILVSSQEISNITNKLLSSGAAPLYRLNSDQADQGNMLGGALVTRYLNKYAFGGPQAIPIRLHPYVPYGTIIFRPTKVPYQISNVGTILRMNCRKDYYQLNWPLVTRQREWGIYNETVLQNYAPFMFAKISNIADK